MASPVATAFLGPSQPRLLPLPATILYCDNAIGIDCGSGFPKSQFEGETIGRLACLRLDDMKVFYSEEEGIDND